MGLFKKCCDGCCPTACDRVIDTVDIDVILAGVTNTYTMTIGKSLREICAFMQLEGKTCMELRGEFGSGGSCTTSCGILTDFSFTVTWSSPPPVDTTYSKIEIGCGCPIAKLNVTNTVNSDLSVQTNAWTSERFVGRYLCLTYDGLSAYIDLTEGNTCYTNATIAARIKAGLVALGHPQITTSSISVSVSRSPMDCGSSLGLLVAQRSGTRVCSSGSCPAPESLPSQLTPPSQCVGGTYSEVGYPFDVVQSNTVYSETIFTNSESRYIIGLIFTLVDGRLAVRPLYSKTYSVSTRTITKRQIITRHFYGQWTNGTWLCYKYQDTCATTVESDVTTTTDSFSECIAYLTSSRTCSGEDASGFFSIATVTAGTCFSVDEYSCTTTWNDSGLTPLPGCGFTPLSTTYTTLSPQTITWNSRFHYA